MIPRTISTKASAITVLEEFEKEIGNGCLNRDMMNYLQTLLEWLVRIAPEDATPQIRVDGKDVYPYGPGPTERQKDIWPYLQGPAERTMSFEPLPLGPDFSSIAYENFTIPAMSRTPELCEIRTVIEEFIRVIAPDRGKRLVIGVVQKVDRESNETEYILRIKVQAK